MYFSHQWNKDCYLVYLLVAVSWLLSWKDILWVYVKHPEICFAALKSVIWDYWNWSGNGMDWYVFAFTNCKVQIYSWQLFITLRLNHFLKLLSLGANKIIIFNLASYF